MTSTHARTQGPPSSNPCPPHRIDHIVYAVRRENLVSHVEKAKALFNADFEHLYGPDITGLGVESYISWETGIDFVAPHDGESPLGASLLAFLEEKGEGIWGFVFRVDDVAEAVDNAGTVGLEKGSVSTLLDDAARRARVASWTKKVTDLQQVWIGNLAGGEIYLSQIDYA